jgi:hypothetical protein
MAARLQSIFQSLNLKYLTTNDWSGVDKQTRKSKEGRIAGRIVGVEPRRCPEGHMLEGEYGLFATKHFDPCDVIGEYVGVIQRAETPYCADLHGRCEDDSLGVNSEKEGNELRFINDFHGIADCNNVSMRRCFIDSLPRVLIVCERAIEEGEEILTSYGEGYCKAWLGKSLAVSSVLGKSKPESLMADVAQSSSAALPVPINGAGAAAVGKTHVAPDTVYSHCDVGGDVAVVVEAAVIQ